MAIDQTELKDEELNQVAGGWTSWTRHSTPGYGTPQGERTDIFTRSRIPRRLEREPIQSFFLINAEEAASVGGLVRFRRWLASCQAVQRCSSRCLRSWASMMALLGG